MEQNCLIRKANFFFVIALILNVALWAASHHVRLKWTNVPLAPTLMGAKSMGLGDTQFFFRHSALAFQNFGDTGGRVTSLKEYDYSKIDKWLQLFYQIDKKSDHIPMIAAYYFGGMRGVPEKTRIIVDYLAKAGHDVNGEKWRWLAQAAFLARHRLNDLDYALELATKLSKMRPLGDELPMWARQMPAFILTAQGEKDAARRMMEAILITDKGISPNEINFMVGYLKEELGVKEEDIGKTVLPESVFKKMKQQN